MTAHLRKHRQGIPIPPVPPLALEPRSDRALVTVAVGAEATAMLAITRPFMEAYAQRLGIDFVVLDWPGNPAWGMSTKFAIYRALEHYERIAYVDADVLMRPGCVDLFSLCEPTEFGICNELELQRKHFGDDRIAENYYHWQGKMGLPQVVQPFYLNTGVMVAPRSHAEILHPPATIFPGNLAEQEWFNYRLFHSALPARIMDRRGNWQHWTNKGFTEAPWDAILHFSGMTGKERLTLLSSWAATAPLNTDSWAIDSRHRDWIRRELLTGRYRRVLEIGSHKGYSTQAFLDALQAGAVDEVHLCEPAPTPTLLALIEGTHAVLHRCRSVDLLAKDRRWDMVFADGSHLAEDVRPEATMLLGVPAVFAHDVAADSRYPNCEGARLYLEIFEAAGYHVIVDSSRRPGERTERGMMLATCPAEAFPMA